MRGAIAAQTLGVFEAYVEAMFVAMWERGLKMDDPAVVGATLAEAGLPAERLLALTQEASVKERLAANTAAAVDQGVFGAPTFFVGEDMYFGKDRLRDVEEALRMKAD